MDLKVFEKGQVWWYDGSDLNKDAMDNGITVGARPVIILRKVETVSKTVTIIPLTASSIDLKNGVRISIEKDKESVALIHEMRPVPYDSLIRFLGTLSDEAMSKIDTAVSIYLGLNKQDTDAESEYFPYQKSPVEIPRDK